MSGAYEFKAASDADLGIGLPPDPDESVYEDKEEKDSDKAEDTSKDDDTEVVEEPVDEEKVESKTSEEDDEDDEDDTKGKKIPYKRFKKEIEKAHTAKLELEAARRELEELRAEKQVKTTAKQEEDDAYDFDAKEEEYLRLAGEFNNKDAAKLRQEINNKMAERIAAHSQRELREEIAQLKRDQKHAIEKAEIDTVAKDIIEKFPFLDLSSKKADKEMIQDVYDMREFLRVQKGMSPAAALK